MNKIQKGVLWSLNQKIPEDVATKLHKFADTRIITTENLSDCYNKVVKIVT